MTLLVTGVMVSVSLAFAALYGLLSLWERLRGRAPKALVSSS